mgnify:CR=1 FL=1|jgi:hypothetical protein
MRAERRGVQQEFPRSLDGHGEPPPSFAQEIYDRFIIYQIAPRYAMADAKGPTKNMSSGRTTEGEGKQIKMGL